jgi:hypothetical protein
MGKDPENLANARLSGSLFSPKYAGKNLNFDFSPSFREKPGMTGNKCTLVAQIENFSAAMWH